jgi:HSP20 family protein
MLYTQFTTTPPVFGLRREIDRLFEDTFGRGQVGQNEWSPKVDIRETDMALTFAVELPGIKLEHLELTTDESVLTIHGAKTDETNVAEEGRYHLVERTYGAFTRRFQLPQGVDAEKIEAGVENGILTVRIPKMALAQPKKIRIQTGAEVSAGAQQALANGESRKNPSKKLVAANA